MQELEVRVNKRFSLKDVPFIKGVDAALQEFKVARQAYYGGTFVGNHVHRCLHVSKQTTCL